MSNVLHVKTDRWRASCNVTLELDESQAKDAADVPRAERCLRPGCRARWHRVDLDGRGAQRAAPAVRRG